MSSNSFKRYAPSKICGKVASSTIRYIAKSTEKNGFQDIIVNYTIMNSATKFILHIIKVVTFLDHFGLKNIYVIVISFA